MSGELLYFNGVNSASGDYDLPPMTPLELFDYTIVGDPAVRLAAG